MKVSQTGLDLIKHFEGLSLKAYKCPAGVWTIGYGTTGVPEARLGVVISAARAEELLAIDVDKFSRQVWVLVSDVVINQHQMDALIAFAYNVGIGAFKTSTLLKKLLQKDYTGASKEFLRWTKAKGKELPGLVKRRRAESLLFLGGDWRTVIK
jgi:lysozyme